TFTGVVPTSRTLTAGTGLSGGGDLTADRSFSVDSTVWRDANTPSGSQIMTLTNGVSVGEVGTYGFLKNKGSGTLDPGDTETGSNLKWASIDTDNTTEGTSPSGTWECCGYCPTGKVSLFRRTV